MPAANKKIKKGSGRMNVRPLPVGGVKIREAFRALLEEKEFNRITTAQISKKSGVNEALIYKYFGDKRGLLHQVLRDYLDEYLGQMESELKGIKGTFNKLKKIVWSQMNLYETKRVLAKILLLEVRNYPGYFESESYGQVQRFSRIITELLKEGIKNGEIRNDIPVTSMRQVMLGGIEHLCLPKIIYGKPYSANELTRELCMAIFQGIAKRPS
ncbi:MAG: TetR/AcrR family transcriptional regulator [Syntrophales bacterium]|jgi:TetR/AcrR family transcriptional regulator, fatty acid metabolism regulator protein